MLQYNYNQNIYDWNTKQASFWYQLKGILDMLKKSNIINEKYEAKNKQTTPKIILGSTCSVTNHDNEMKFQPWVV